MVLAHTSDSIQYGADDHAPRVVDNKVSAVRPYVAKSHHLGQCIYPDVPNSGLVLSEHKLADVEQRWFDDSEISPISAIQLVLSPGYNTEEYEAYFASLRFLYFSLLYSVFRAYVACISTCFLIISYLIRLDYTSGACQYTKSECSYRTDACTPDFFNTSISSDVNGCTNWPSLISSFVASVSST
jgi:hypothetical protein